MRIVVWAPAVKNWLILLIFFITAVWEWQSTHASSESTVVPRQWDHTYCTTPYNWALSLDNNHSQVDLSQSTWMCLWAEWMKQQFLDIEKEREHCGPVTRAFVIARTEANTFIVGQAGACPSLSHAMWQLGCVTPLSPWQRPVEGEENAIIVYQLNQSRFRPGFAHC